MHLINFEVSSLYTDTDYIISLVIRVGALRLGFRIPSRQYLELLRTLATGRGEAWLPTDDILELRIPAKKYRDGPYFVVSAKSLAVKEINDD